MPLSKKSISAVLGLTVLLVAGIVLFLLRDDIHLMLHPEENLIGRWELLATAPDEARGLTVEFAWEDKAEGTIMCLILGAEVLGTFFYRVEGADLEPISIGGTEKAMPCRFRFESRNTLVLTTRDQTLRYTRVSPKSAHEIQGDVERSSRR